MTQSLTSEPARAEHVPVLWHFQMSHFNEKVRWALDYKGIPHVRRALVPGLHIPRLMWMSRQKQVPVLVMRGEVLVGSADIIQALERAYPDPPLYPAEPSERQRALELARFLDDELGPTIRLAAFYEMLPHTALCAELFGQALSAPGRVLYRIAFPAVRSIMRRDMKIDARNAQEAFEKTLVVLSRLDNLIQPGSYLVGTSFSVADLTAAALLSPVACPPEYPYPLPGNSEPFVRFRERIGHRRVIDWCRFIYAKHRGRSSELQAAA